MQKPTIKKITNNEYEVTYPNHQPKRFMNIKPVPLSKAEPLLNSLHPVFKVQVLQFLNLLSEQVGKDYFIQINDALRTDSEQQQLYQNNPQYAKQPGDSPHNFGLAVDFSVVDRKTGKAVTSDQQIQKIIDDCAKKTKLYWGGWFVSMPKEPWHIQISRDWKQTYKELIATR